MRDILISTAGTSLLGNIKHHENKKLQHFMDEKDSFALCRELLNINQSQRICGAEINSVASIVEKDLVHGRALHLILVSDTSEGRFVGEVLQKFYSSKKNNIQFDKTACKVIPGLSADNVKRFKNEGLKNLVSIIGETVRQFGSQRILINATGGYKAQISFAGMIGQALEIPVCYMFESFSEVIELPPQPVSFDLGFWLENVDLFYELDKTFDIDDCLPFPDDRFAMLVEHEEVDGRHMYALSSAGQLFHETFRYRFRQRDFIPKRSVIPVGKKKIRYEDGNSGKHKGLSTWLERLKQVSFVNGIYTFYYHPDLGKKNSFKKDRENRKNAVEGRFSNNGGLTKFILSTESQTGRERDSAIAWLNENFL
jgi:putative CRISPR-associated protein (TIGR02619 family)